MNYLRKLVSGKRRRFQDSQFDLDMTYITPRVVAMSFPASGVVETTYRNPIHQVARFLKDKHGSKYWVYNCSERTYDKAPFDNQGSDFLWRDHHAPTLHLLFDMVKAMYEFLMKDQENVVVVHCNSGKGRTGTAIATLLLYTGFVEDMDDALKYYGWRRFSSGIGVSQPCQLRTIYYFEAAMKGIIVAPCVKKLKAIVFKTVPIIANDGCRPYFEITNNVDDHIIYTSKVDLSQGTQVAQRYYSALNEQAMLFDFEDGKEPIISGDVDFAFKHRGVITDSQICRIAFNTAFIPYNNKLTFYKTTISPDKLKKDTRFSKEFIVQFVFEDYCQKCGKPWNLKLDEICHECGYWLRHDIQHWQSIQQIVAERPKFTLKEGVYIHFRSESEDQSEKKTLLGLKLLFNSENYKIQMPSKSIARIQAEEEQEVELPQKDQFEESKSEPQGFISTEAISSEIEEQFDEVERLQGEEDEFSDTEEVLNSQGKEDIK